MDNQILNALAFYSSVSIAAVCEGAEGGRCKISFGDNLFTIITEAYCASNNLIGLIQGNQSCKIGMAHDSINWDDWSLFWNNQDKKEVIDISNKGSLVSAFMQLRHKDNDGRSYAEPILHWLKKNYPMLKIKDGSRLINNRIPVIEIEITSNDK